MPHRLVLAALLALTFASAPAQAQPVETFPLSSVRLLDGPFRHAQTLDLAYLMAMDPDRLLAPFLQEAGLEPRASMYGSWEAEGLGGQTGGHYLSALAFQYASTGNQLVLDRLRYMLSELRRAQEANGNGYVGGVPNHKELWAEVAAGDIRTGGFDLNGAWVPWYNLHKLFAGLRDAYLVAGVEEARPILVDLADWTRRLTGGLSDAQMQTMLRAEQGGMNEVLADAAAITGDTRYLELARRFSHRAILDPLLAHEDQLTGIHANTQIPKVIGFKRIADVASEENQDGYGSWSDAAFFFWDTVVHGRSVAFGGNSVSEHFNAKDDFSRMILSPEGPETCNTYNMLRLTRMLFETRPDAAFMDYYERALYNHILSSQNPEHGGLVYFTSIRPSHYRVYSQPGQAMWCCVGTGIENHSKYGEMIYAHRGSELFVNLYIASALNWREQGVAIRQTTRFPDEETSTITVETPGAFALNLRYPGWVAPGAMRVAVNGAEQPVAEGPGSFVRLERSWKAGDEVRVTLPMRTRVERLPDGSPYFAVLHGPIVLAAKTDPLPGDSLDFIAGTGRMEHIATGPMAPLDETPYLLSNDDDFAAAIQPVAGEPLTFRAPGLIRGADHELTLIPFFRVHDSRYVMYWPHFTPAEWVAAQQARHDAEQERIALDALTIDHVAVGEQQPESDHYFAGEGSETGMHMARRWRHATGWFSYNLRNPGGEAARLRVDYFGQDRDRRFRILMNGVEVAQVELDGSHGNEFYSIDYPVPREAIAKAEDGVLVTEFRAEDGSTAGGVYGVRLMRAE